MNPYNIFNFIYFHKRRITVGTLFFMSYATICYKSTSIQNEGLRLGIAGSIANCMCECGFHIIDTINIRSKVVSKDVKSSSTYQQVRQIYNKEGLYGFGRGFSACFYGSIFCGFSFFYIYKNIKR